MLLQIAKQVEPDPLIETISKPQVLSLLNNSMISLLQEQALAVKELSVCLASKVKSFSLIACSTLLMLGCIKFL